MATARVGPGTRLRIVDALVSGVHERGSSHFELLRAFQRDDLLERMTDAAAAAGYRTHEFGDLVLLSRRRSHERAPAHRASSAHSRITPRTPP
jgi:S-adenosylmethionine:tRNA ribosyltransferase-isomerase